MNKKNTSGSFYINSLDGIRAIAVMIVFLAHAGYEKIIPGGFGVTIFIFLSGFLITTLLRMEYEKNGEELINFVVGVQNTDGSWYYGFDHSNDNFIDNFHTCFVLKNLIKSSQINSNLKINNTIEKGMNYYFKNLFDGNYTIPFSYNTRIQLVDFEMYDVAEFIN